MLTHTDVTFHIPDNSQGAYEIIGQGLKHLLVITEKNSMNNEDTTMLNKMLSAIHHDSHSDVRLLIITNGGTFNLSQLDIEIKNIISFGIPPSQLGFSVPYQYYKPINFETIWALFVDDLGTIRTQATKKQNLWNCLKNKFLQ